MTSIITSDNPNGVMGTYMNNICGTGTSDPSSTAGPFGPAGCSIITVLFDGAQDRVLNEYYLQPYNPSGFVAYANTMYQKTSFQGNDVTIKSTTLITNLICYLFNSDVSASNSLNTVIFHMCDECKSSVV